MPRFMSRRISLGLLALLWASFALAGAPALAQAPPSKPVSVPGVDPLWLSPLPRPELKFDPVRLPSRQSVLLALDYVASAQIADMSARPLSLASNSLLKEISANWVASTFYVGAARLARVSNERRTLQFLSAVADHYNYAFRGARAQTSLLNADELAIGDLYQELYVRRREPGTLLPLTQRLDLMVPHLAREVETPQLIWWWCDALYMAPPILARMSTITGDPKYLRAMDKEWRRTADRLWVEDDRLYLRDERFRTRLGAHGKPIYWARGNGWVIAGLARTLEVMPADFEGRGFYIETFEKMAARIVELQQADGLWRADLNDPGSFPEPETSGSAFFVYGLAWGVNHGLLDRATYLPHVTQGWAALNRQILPNGLVGAAQKTGDRPVSTQADDVGPYATGAYLLAGLEVMALSEAARPLPAPQPLQDDAATIAATLPPRGRPPVAYDAAEAARRAEEGRAARALAYDLSTLEGDGR